MRYRLGCILSLSAVVASLECFRFAFQILMHSQPDALQLKANPHTNPNAIGCEVFVFLHDPLHRQRRSQHIFRSYAVNIACCLQLPDTKMKKCYQSMRLLLNPFSGRDLSAEELIAMAMDDGYVYCLSIKNRRKKA